MWFFFWKQQVFHRLFFVQVVLMIIKTELGVFVVISNNLHGIIAINDNGRDNALSLRHVLSLRHAISNRHVTPQKLFIGLYYKKIMFTISITSRMLTVPSLLMSALPKSKVEGLPPQI